MKEKGQLLINIFFVKCTTSPLDSASTTPLAKYFPEILKEEDEE